jgi:hypothetical protein
MSKKSPTIELGFLLSGNGERHYKVESNPAVNMSVAVDQFMTEVPLTVDQVVSVWSAKKSEKTVPPTVPKPLVKPAQR